MNCPCGCQRPVPHGRFWFSTQCRRKVSSAKIKVPKPRTEFDSQLRRKRYIQEKVKKLRERHER